MKEWSETKSRLLEKLWPNHTATEISKIMDDHGYIASRRAVIGRAWRMGLPPKGQRKAPAKIQVRRIMPVDLPTEGLSYMTCLAVDGCQYHTGAYSLDAGWCGASREDGPYCAKHTLWVTDFDGTARRIRVPAEKVIIEPEAF